MNCSLDWNIGLFSLKIHCNRFHKTVLEEMMYYVKFKLKQSVIKAGVLFLFVLHVTQSVCGVLLVCRLSK